MTHHPTWRRGMLAAIVNTTRVNCADQPSYTYTTVGLAVIRSVSRDGSIVRRLSPVHWDTAGLWYTVVPRPVASELGQSSRLCPIYLPPGMGTHDCLDRLCASPTLGQEHTWTEDHLKQELSKATRSWPDPPPAA